MVSVYIITLPFYSIFPIACTYHNPDNKVSRREFWKSVLHFVTASISQKICMSPSIGIKVIHYMPDITIIFMSSIIKQNLVCNLMNECWFLSLKLKSMKLFAFLFESLSCPFSPQEIGAQLANENFDMPSSTQRYILTFLQCSYLIDNYFYWTE